MFLKNRKEKMNNENQEEEVENIIIPVIEE